MSETEPTGDIKDGALWVNPTDGSAAVYDVGSSSFVDIVDIEAQTIASSKNTTYVQNDPPTGGTYLVGDLWIDINDGNKLYAWDGSSWVQRRDGGIATAQATADGKNTIYRQTTTPTGGTYVSGDIWFDVDDNNRIYRYSSTTNTSTVSNKALTSNVATLTTSAAHFFTPGETITVTGVDATFNGSYTVKAVPTATTLTYDKTAGTVASTASSGTITNTAGWKAAVLGGSALANISANSINTGTLDANIVTVSNINAGNISTGTLDASIVTVRNAVGNDRVELNSLGLYAYQGGVATVSITNTGTAVFSGNVNAKGGTFTGYVQGGSMRFGASVQTNKNGIYINANNYWYDNGDFSVGSSGSIAGTTASTLVSNAAAGASALQPGGTLTGTVAGTATIGTETASTVVSNAATGATALQSGNGVSKDALTNQITKISTKDGIVVSTDADLTGNSARVEINNTGFYAYNGTTQTVKIGSDGSAEFTGAVKASSFTSTNTSAGGIVISERVTGSDSIKFYDGSTLQGRIESYSTGGYSGISIWGPNVTGYQRIQFSTLGSVVLVPGGTGGTVQVLNRAGSQSVIFSSQGIELKSDVASVAVGTSLVRNIIGYASTAGFAPTTDTTGNIGDIALVYTA